jgi:acid stress-induced BolA-like protein IbaG/YrbA
MRSTVLVSMALSLLVACGSSEPESAGDTLAGDSGDETSVEAEPVAAEPAEEPAEASHHPDTRWPDAPRADARFHLILHPIDINADNVEPDAVAEINQFFIDHIHAEAPEVFVAPPGSPIPDGMLGYVLEPAIEVVDDQPDRCHVEVQLILMTHEDDLRADIPTSAAAVEGEGHHRQRHAVQGAFAGGLRLLRQALEASARRDAT